MVKCNNCGNDAAYTNTDLGGNHTHYCVECLPNWLNQRAIAGEFPLVTPAESKSSAKRKRVVEDKPALEEELPAEEPAAEEPSVEEAPADENN